LRITGCHFSFGLQPVAQARGVCFDSGTICAPLRESGRHDGIAQRRAQRLVQL
jgi:hypothetical protein